MLFFIIPTILACLTAYSYEPDLVECQDNFVCKNDEAPDQEIDKFDLKMQAAPASPWPSGK